jgi:hypothetical protein
MRLMELTSKAPESITLKVDVGAPTGVNSTRLAFSIPRDKVHRERCLYLHRIVMLQLTWSTFYKVDDR